jgi:hypothetical protein
MSFFHFLGHAKEEIQVQGTFETFCNKKNFYSKGLLASQPTPKLENHPLSAAHN